MRVNFNDVEPSQKNLEQGRAIPTSQKIEHYTCDNPFIDKLFLIVTPTYSIGKMSRNNT
jgi:hypothetical protein